MKERGSALLTVVISILLLTMTSGIFFSLAMSNTELVNSEKAAIIANNLADSGIQYGISVLKEIEFNVGDELPSPETKSNPLGIGGSFSVQWVELPEENAYMIISTGVYGKVTRVKTAGFVVKMEDDDETSEPGGGSPGGGNYNYPTWDSTHRYVAGDYIVCRVTIDGVTMDRLYYARHNGYAGEEPGKEYTTWQEVTNHFRKSNFYEFRSDDDINNRNIIVFYGSSYWLLRWNSYGSTNIPGQNSSPSSAAWRELVDEWRPYESYPANEVVTYNGKRYRVKWNNPPGPPDSSNPNGPWELLDDSVRTLIKVTISPSSTTIKEGEQISFTAIAHFSDGTTEDVTDKAVWKTTYPQIASISGNIATGKMDTGVEGCNSTLISASYTYIHPTRNDIVINRVGVMELKVSEPSGKKDPGVIIWEREISSGT